MKRIICLLLAAALLLGLAGCGMVSDRVLAVEKVIDELGEVTLESADKIAEARKAFEKLPEKEKKDVTNSRKLIAAEEELQDLKNNGTVTELIDAIWSLRDIVPSSEEAIDSLQERFDKLPQKLRDRVNNSGRLQEARDVLAVSEIIESLGDILPALKEVPARLKEAGEGSLADVPEILTGSKESIDKALKAVEALDPDLRRMLGNKTLLEDAQDWYQAAQYAVAEKYFGEWEMDKALELYRQFPEDYKETASRIVSAEDFLSWQAARADLPGKWVWDGRTSAGSDGKAYRADFPELTIRELKPDDAFAGIRFRERRLLYVEIVPGTVKKAELSQTVLNKLHELRPKSFTAANIDSYLHLDDHLDGGRQVYSGDIPTETGPWEDARLVLHGGIHTHGTSGGSSWDHLLQMTMTLQEDGRLRVEYYVRDRDKVTDPNALPAMAETVVFYYDKQ